MQTDPERIREVEHEAERVLRQRREKPKRGFGEVLEEAPARASPEEEEEETPDPRALKARVAPAETADAASSAPAPIDLDGDAERTSLPRVPPDPRMQQLNRMLDKGQKGKKK